MLNERGSDPRSATALVLGATFKKDVADTRNSKAIVFAELLAARLGKVHVFDPHIIRVGNENSRFKVVGDPFDSGLKYDLIVLTVAHSSFTYLEDRVHGLLSHDGIVMDVTGTVSLSLKHTLPCNLRTL